MTEHTMTVDFLRHYPRVTRIEVIGKERDLVRYGCEDVRVSLQDDGQTLKVFYGWDSEDEAALVELVIKRLAEDESMTKLTLEDNYPWNLTGREGALNALDRLYEENYEGLRRLAQEDNS